MLPRSIPADWADYVRQWEMGVSLVAKTPYESYGCLHNALVHRTVERDIARSWLDGLRLLSEALSSGEGPTALAANIPLPEMATARAFLGFEEQAYVESLSHALCLQLTVSPRHRVGIDHQIARELAHRRQLNFRLEVAASDRFANLLHQLLIDRQAARAGDFILHDGTLIDCTKHLNTVEARGQAVSGKECERNMKTRQR